jgi:hypothetical protein
MKNKLIAVCLVFIWQWVCLNNCQAQGGREEPSLAAEKAFFTKWSQTAATGPEKAQAQWQLDDLLGRSSQETRDPASLIPYIGTYQGGLVFYTDQSGFYCRNAERGNQVFNLIPISGDKFILDENVHVEFTKDNNGNFSGIDMWWSDGRVSNKPRDK